MSRKQFTLKLAKTWDSNNIKENYEELRQNIEWKGFKLTPPVVDEKGFISMDFNSGLSNEDTNILIRRNMIQITYSSWQDKELAWVILNSLLKEDNESVSSMLLESFKETGHLPQQVVESAFYTLIDQYLDLVEGKLSGDVAKATKKKLELSFKSMLKEIIGIENS